MPRTASYARLLRDVSGSLTSGEQQGVGDAVLPLLREAFGATAVTLVRFRSPSTLQLVGASGLERRPGLMRLWDEFDVTAQVPVAEAARTGRPVWIEDVRAERERYPAWPPTSTAVGVCAVPLHAAGRLVGVLGLAFPERREFDAAEQDVLVTVGSIVGAACQLDHQGARRRLGVVDTDTCRDDVRLAHLVRSADTAVPRTVGTVAAHGAPTLSWLLESPHDVALGIACEGVLALARRHGTPPGLAARAVADLGEEFTGEVAGIALQVGADAGWVAVAGVNDCVVLSAPVMAGPEVLTFSGAATPVDEHVIVPDGEGATVLALVLVHGLPSTQARRLVELAQAEFRRDRGASAEDLLARVGERLGEHGADTGLLGALALVIAPRTGVVALHRTLPARPLAVPLARRFALATLGPRPDHDLSFRLGLTVDELVANAVRHCENTVDVTVTPGEQVVRVEVDDDDDRPPPSLRHAAPGHVQDLRESGRGLVLVRAVADDWGVRTRPSGGKTVWAELRR